MNPLLKLFTGRHERPEDDSWQSGRLMASLTFLIFFLTAAWWLFGPEINRYLPQTITIFENQLEISEYYLLVSSVGASLFIIVTVVHVVFNISFLTTPCPSPARTKSGTSEPGQEIESTDLANLKDEDNVEELADHGEASMAATPNTYTHFYDVITIEKDKPRPSKIIGNDINRYEETKQTVRPCSHLGSGQTEVNRLVDNDQSLRDQNRIIVPRIILSRNLDLGKNFVPDDYEKVLQCSYKSVACQCDAISKPASACSETMTIHPELIDASVGSQQLFKIVRSCDTSTSGPFMKKLRRAQRLLKEARVKMKTDRQEKLLDWTMVLNRYKTKVDDLVQSLDKKDILLSYTALNRALSENEVKDMCTAVSSARDRLLTQCKLNFALKEVVESKCESGTPDAPSPNTASPQT